MVYDAASVKVGLNIYDHFRLADGCGGGGEMMTPETKAKLSGKLVVASISGGKDSSAMSLYLTESGIEHQRVFMDTGWESDITYAYLRGPLEKALGHITWLTPALQMEQLIRKKGMFPSRIRRYCTEDLKVAPMARHIKQLTIVGHDVINTVGIRGAESAARSRLPEWEWSDRVKCDVWRPLLSWTMDDVIAIHQRHGLTPNPLYLMGAKRVGCWPCINSSKSEIRLIAERDPGRIVRLRVLESDVAELANLRADKKGVALSHAPAWFQAPNGRTGACWPIDKVVQWSKTIRGGTEEDRQELLFAGQNDGCMRWGMCETLAADDT